MKYNQVKLYHYSNKNIKGRIKPSFFGGNYYTGNDVKASPVRRAFYYLSRHKTEHLLDNSKYLYITEVNRNKLYNLDKDPKDLKSRFIIKGLAVIDITRLLKYIKKSYTGIVYNRNVTAIFKDLKYTRKIERG